MNWMDIQDIAIALHETHPNTDPLTVRFTDLRTLVLSLDAFDPQDQECNERILEAIQMAWLDERS